MTTSTMIDIMNTYGYTFWDDTEQGLVFKDKCSDGQFFTYFRLFKDWKNVSDFLGSMSH